MDCREAHIVTIQRYARGFLVRLRMWREAIRAEEELWAVLEIQRVWRGYHGRVRWEDAYEKEIDVLAFFDIFCFFNRFRTFRSINGFKRLINGINRLLVVCHS